MQTHLASADYQLTVHVEGRGMGFLFPQEERHFSPIQSKPSFQVGKASASSAATQDKTQQVKEITDLSIAYRRKVLLQ